MRRIVLLIFFLGITINSIGQVSYEKTNVRLNMNLDLLSSHLWRGFKNGNSYSIQPTISLNYKNFIVGSWAAFAGNDSYFEVDLFTEYSYRSFTLSVYDYYCPQSTQLNSFTEFSKHQTKHTVDAMLSWKPQRIPFKLFLSTMVLGDDLSGNPEKQTYSTYIEPAFTYSRKKFSGEVFAGFTPLSGYYANKPAFVNVGIALKYNLTIGGFAIPLQSKMSYNPYLESNWIMLGLTLPIKK